MANRMGIIVNSTNESGFAFSDEAVAEYNRLKQLKDSGYIPDDDIHYFKSLRYDQTMVQIVERLGERASKKPARLEVIYIGERFRHAVNIITIDGGYEICEILMHKYILDEIEKTVNNTDSADQKFSRIKHLLQQRDDNGSDDDD